MICAYYDNREYYEKVCHSYPHQRHYRDKAEMERQLNKFREKKSSTKTHYQ